MVPFYQSSTSSLSFLTSFFAATSDSRAENWQVTVDNTTPGQSLDANFGEVVDHPEATVEHFGVPPEELERRLHEVLALRQEERIKELEAALECANRKLSEKEKEVYWWKDTAKLISEHVPSTSR